jgi:hypothetical protein
MYKDYEIYIKKKLIKNTNPNTHFCIKDAFIFYIIQRQIQKS